MTPLSFFITIGCVAAGYYLGKKRAKSQAIEKAEEEEVTETKRAINHIMGLQQICNKIHQDALAKRDEPPSYRKHWIDSKTGYMCKIQHDLLEGCFLLYIIVYESHPATAIGGAGIKTPDTLEFLRSSGNGVFLFKTTVPGVPYEKTVAYMKELAQPILDQLKALEREKQC